MWQIMAFFLGAICLAIISRRVFADPRSHGFFRFLAFLAIWALIVMNLPRWFVDPLSARQILSWLCLFGSIPLALSGFRTLHTRGRPGGSPPASEFAFEQTTQLVTNGVYRYIRHPLYASLLLLAWGTALKTLTVPAILFAVLAAALLWLTARAEELENLERFGEPYELYMSRTHMFIPGLF